jgi:hypothetical protein
MKKFVLASFLTVSLGSVAVFADSFSGYISGAHCGAKHSTVSAANTACVEKCIKGGAAPVLVSDGKVIKFDDASADKAKAFAAENVKIDGSMEGGVLKITSINKAE